MSFELIYFGYLLCFRKRDVDIFFLRKKNNYMVIEWIIVCKLKKYICKNLLNYKCLFVIIFVFCFMSVWLCRILFVYWIVCNKFLMYNLDIIYILKLFNGIWFKCS